MFEFLFAEAAKEKRKGQSGNVLFLILIAVALFAALSYAVTSSTRTGGNAASGETNLISSAQITQYPASISTAVIRMIISGVSADEIRFNRPKNDEFDDLRTTKVGVFHPNGGNATYIPAPSAVMEDDEPGEWFFNAELEVPDIGLSDEGGNEIIAFLPGLRKSICLKINEEYGIGAKIPQLTSSRKSEYTERMYDDGSSDYEIPDDNVPDIDDGAGSFDGQPFGCFKDGTGGDYVYYHVVLER